LAAAASVVAPRQEPEAMAAQAALEETLREV